VNDALWIIAAMVGLFALILLVPLLLVAAVIEGECKRGESRGCSTMEDF
jgi:hypothetical protein